MYVFYYHLAESLQSDLVVLATLESKGILTIVDPIIIISGSKTKQWNTVKLERMINQFKEI